MEKRLFHYIYKNSKPEQAKLSLIIWLSYPIYLLSLELPKVIVNEALVGKSDGVFNFSLLGISLTFDGAQLHFLFILCFAFLVAVLLSGYLKFIINVGVGRLGERMLRRLRYQLYTRIMRFPEKYLKNINSGEVVNMVTAEVEPIAGFSGESFSTPQFYGGQLVVALGFILYQNWLLGLAALAFYPFQIWIIPKLQAKVNALAKKRIQEVRKLSEQVNMTIRNVQELRANSTIRYEFAHINHYLARIYWLRFDIFQRKFFIKYLNNFIDKLTPFFFFLIGGYLIIQGELELGSLIAVLSAYKDIGGPWKEMIKWYQQKEDIRVKFEQVVVKFQPDDMLSDATITTDDTADIAIQTPATITVQNLSVSEGDTSLLHDISASFMPTKNYAIMDNGSGEATTLLETMARVKECRNNSLLYGDTDFNNLPYSASSAYISYANDNMLIINGSIYDNITYILRQHPIKDDEEQMDIAESKEAAAVGGTHDNWLSNWIENNQDTHHEILHLVHLLELQDELLNMGLYKHLNDAEQADTMQDALVQTRMRFNQLLHEHKLHHYVTYFDSDSYNMMAPVIENIIYGAPKNGASIMSLSNNQHFKNFIQQQGAEEFFIHIGINAILALSDIFKDLPPGHELYKKITFIDADNLQEYRQMAQKDSASLTQDESDFFFDIAMQLNPTVHRLGIIDDTAIEKILQLRSHLLQETEQELSTLIIHYDYKQYQDNLTIIDNIIFGKVDTTKLNALEQLKPIIAEAIGQDTLYAFIISLGLQADVGSNGSKLSKILRIKIGVMRLLLKNTPFIIIDNLLNGLGSDMQQHILQTILQYRQGKSTIMSIIDTQYQPMFDSTYIFDNKKLKETHNA